MSLTIKDGTGTTQTLDTVTGSSTNLAISHNTEGTKATYSAAIFGLVSATSAIDLVTISAGASKDVRVTRIGISGTGTAKSLDIAVQKRGGLSTGGTPAAMTAIPHDSSDVAATATVTSYTGATTVVSNVGAIRMVKWTIQAADSATGPTQIINWDFTTRNGKGIKIAKGTSQQVGVAFNAATTVTAPLINIDIEWTEES